MQGAALVAVTVPVAAVSNDEKLTTSHDVATAATHENLSPAAPLAQPPIPESTVTTPEQPNIAPTTSFDPASLHAPAALSHLVGKISIATVAFDPEFDDDLGLAVGDAVEVVNVRSGELLRRRVEVG